MHGSTSLVPAGDAFASQVEAFQISSPRRPSRESMAFRMHPQNAAETGKKLKNLPRRKSGCPQVLYSYRLWSRSPPSGPRPSSSELTTSPSGTAVRPGMLLPRRPLSCQSPAPAILSQPVNYLFDEFASVSAVPFQPAVPTPHHEPPPSLAWFPAGLDWPACFGASPPILPPASDFQ
jgi:hypothetical protein